MRARAFRRLATVADALSLAAKRLSIKLIYHRVGDMESAHNRNIRKKEKKKNPLAYDFANFDSGNGTFRDFRDRRRKSHSMSVKMIPIELSSLVDKGILRVISLRTIHGAAERAPFTND